MRKILYTKKYGSGWVTHNEDLPIEAKRFMLEYPPLIKHVENGGKIEDVDIRENEYGRWVEIIKCPIVQQMVNEMQEKWPNIEVTTSGAKNLGVEEVPDNRSVQITEYDGQESVYVSSEIWL